MSCCGEAKKPADDFNRPEQQFQQGWVNQQPGPQPMLEKPGGMNGSYNATEFRPPSLPSPPPMLSYNNNGMNGSQVQMQMQPPQGAWRPPSSHQSPSPPPPTGSPYQTTTAFSADSHSMRQSTYSQPFGMGGPSALSPPPMTATPMSSTFPPIQRPPVDEGKMSISIDFGV